MIQNARKDNEFDFMMCFIQKALVDMDAEWWVSVAQCVTVQHTSLIHLCTPSPNDSYHVSFECEVLGCALRYSASKTQGKTTFIEYLKGRIKEKNFTKFHITKKDMKKITLPGMLFWKRP